ncbi:MAG: deoxyribodipyrimidine photolyase [Chitinophagia bacterium]|nr:deoxyribodipyrimidine photolyase [Chitinophagia bacterium]
MQNLNRINFPTDYASILERITTIDPINYAKTRNFLNGQITYLSPYISRGVISVKQILDSILNKGYPIQAAEKLIQELAWREYYQRVWQSKNNLIWEDLKQIQPNFDHRNMLVALDKAQTGIAVIDREINNLYDLGYLHNHIRMYLAAIACNIAKAHWLQPSKWMYYHLLDGDIASNNCSWQWVSGAFSGKKYYCNQENINKYTLSQQWKTFLDAPYEDLVNMPIPSHLQESFSLQLNTNLPLTNLPVIDITIPTLIYNSYNLDPIWRKDENVNRVLLLEPSHFKQYPVSDKVIEFIINLSKNINGMQVYTGELEDIQKLYPTTNSSNKNFIISKEHPAFNHYTGSKEEREWMFPTVTGYYSSFFNYWKNCQINLTNEL